MVSIGTLVGHVMGISTYVITNTSKKRDAITLPVLTSEVVELIPSADTHDHERFGQEKIEKEKERREQERREQERREQERREQEKKEQEKKEQEKKEQEKKEQERRDAQRREQERLDREKRNENIVTDQESPYKTNTRLREGDGNGLDTPNEKQRGYLGTKNDGRNDDRKTYQPLGQPGQPGPTGLTIPNDFPPVTLPDRPREQFIPPTRPKV